MAASDKRPVSGEVGKQPGALTGRRDDLPSESTHWYRKDGSPCYEMTCSSKDGMRPTTIKDARKRDLVPSVTQILSVAAKPGLEAWKARQVLEASLTLPQFPEETLDDYAVRVMDDSKAQSQKARDIGTELHASIERWFMGEPEPKWMEHIIAVARALHQLGISELYGKLEHSFASPLGYGGKIDFHNDEPLVIDFKTKKRIDDSNQLSWPEHIQQLAAYGYGVFGGPVVPPDGTPLIWKNEGQFRALNVFIGIEDKQVRVVEYEWPDIVEAFAQFRCLLEYWQRIKNFGPYAK